MSTASEGTININGEELYTKTWTPSGPIKARLVLVHGFSDHINVFNPFCPVLAERGIEVLAWDQRGWGRSPKTKKLYGLTGDTTRVISDVAAFVKDKLSDVPLFVIGHSMGGGEVITFAADPQYAETVSQVRGFLLACPYIAFAPESEPSALRVFAGRMASKLMPHFQMKFPITPDKVTRDAAAIEELNADPLLHYTGTLEGLASLLDRTTALSGGRVRMGANVKSLWMGHATEDLVCSYPRAMAWFEAQDTADKTGKPYEGAYHHIFRDTCKDEVADDISRWILERSGPATAGEATATATTTASAAAPEAATAPVEAVQPKL